MRSEPVSRRNRPAKPPLSRSAIVDASLRVMRADGLAKVTMRRIAAELDTGPASLYVYVSSVVELHGAMLDQLLADVELPTRVIRSTWRRAVVDVLVQLTRVLYREPALALSAVSLRPSGPRYLALLDWLLLALRRGGVSPATAAWGVDLLLQRAIATAAEHGIRSGAADGGADQATLVDAVDEADPRQLPGLAWGRPFLFTGGQDRLPWSFEILLAGICADQ